MDVGPPIDELHFVDAPNVDTVPGPRSRRLLERQRQIDSSAIAYPKRLPLAIDAANGATLRDADGNLFLDFFGGIGVLNVGHSNPYVLEGVKEQLDRVTHTLDFPTESRLDLIEAIDDIAPGGLSGSSRTIFGGPSGSDAIEGTIKLAKHNTGRNGLIAFRGAYHGGTSGALSLTGGKKYKAGYTPLLPDVVHLRYPSPVRNGLDPERSVEIALEEVRETLHDEYGGLAEPAGIWVEPIQGEGGVVVPPEGFLPGLKELAEEAGIPLIVDEIQSGMGRTGKWFACEWDDVTPDAVTLAKGIGGVGLPLGAAVYHERLDTWGAGGHIGTFRGFAPAMRAGVRAIEYIRAHDILAHTRTLGEYIRSRLNEAKESAPDLIDVRGRGLFIGAEFKDSHGGPSAKQRVKDIQDYCFQHGVIVWSAGRDGNVLRLVPPLVLTREQAETGLDIIVRAIEATG